MEKTFQEFMTESITLAKNVQYREDNGGTSQVKMSKTLDNKYPIAWFSFKGDSNGFAVHVLNEYDHVWFKAEKQSTKNVYRYATDKVIGIIKLDVAKGIVSFFDNKHLEETDDIKFERPSKPNIILLDKEFK